MKIPIRKIFLAGLAPLLLLLTISSCETLDEAGGKKKAETPTSTDTKDTVDAEDPFKTTPSKESSPMVSVNKNAKLNPVSADLVQQPVLPPEKTTAQEIAKVNPGSPFPQPAKVNPFYEKFLSEENAEEALKIEVTFNAASLADVVPAFAQLLKFNYIIDPQVKGAVSMTVNSQMTRREVWQMFEQILWLSGAYCSPEGDLLHVLPFAKMPQERRIFAKHDPGANVEVSFLCLRNSASKDVLEKIKPFLTEGATAIDIPHQNAILLVEAPSNIPKLKELVELLDHKNKANWPQAVIHCSKISATRIKNELAVMLPVLGFPVTIDNVVAEPGSIHLVALERLQVLVAAAANNEALDELRNWVSILDSSDVGEQEQIFIYEVANNKADDLVQAISALFNVDGTSLSPSSTPSNTPSTSSTGNQTNTTATTSASKTSAPVPSNATAIKGGQKNSSADGPSNVFEVPVKIFADSVQNRLVIKTVPRTYAMINAVLTRLDTAAAQVLLQVVVSEITLTDSTQFGIEFSDKQGAQNGKVTSLFGTNYSALNPTATNEYGFRYNLFNSSNPDEKFAYLKALAGSGKIQVLSAPQIVVKSHSEAKINVGEKVPIITSEITDTASTTATDTSLRRSIQYEPTGIILTITPHVTTGGLITVELQQEVSDAFPNSTSDIDSPVIQQRVVSTSMAINDGSTLIVAGLIRNRDSDNLSSVPFISKIPVIGRLFGSNTIETTKTELVVMITGKIITKTSKLSEITARYKTAMANIQKNLQEKETK